MKKKISTIDKKVLVEGPEGAVMQNEMLVTRDSKNKIVLKEYVNGALTAVSSSGVYSPLETLLDSCVTFKKVTSPAANGTITFTVAGSGKLCICRSSATAEQQVSIVTYSSPSVAVTCPSGGTIYVAFPETVTAGTVDPATMTQENIEKSAFMSKISYFI